MKLVKKVFTNFWKILRNNWSIKNTNLIRLKTFVFYMVNAYLYQGIKITWIKRNVSFKPVFFYGIYITVVLIASGKYIAIKYLLRLWHVFNIYRSQSCDTVLKLYCNYLYFLLGYSKKRFYILLQLKLTLTFLCLIFNCLF